VAVTADNLIALGQGRFASDDTALAEDIITRVWGAIRDYCEWHITPVQRETLIVDGTGGPLLQLPTLHLVQVHSVREDGEDLDLAEVEWSTDGSVRKRSGRWTERWRGIEINIEHGYANVPGIDDVVLSIAARRMTAPAGQIRLRVGQTDEQLGDALGSDLAVLDRYALGTTG